MKEPKRSQQATPAYILIDQNNRDIFSLRERLELLLNRFCRSSFCGQETSRWLGPRENKQVGEQKLLARRHGATMQTVKPDGTIGTAQSA